MSLDCELRRDALSRILKAAAKVAKPINRSVAGCLIEAATGLTISATDGSLTVVATCPGEVKAPGVCAVDPTRLARAVASLGEDVHLKLKADTLAVSGGGGRFELPIMPVDALPRMVIPEAPPFLTAPAAELAAWIGNAAYCASQDRDRTNVLGVYVESIAGGNLIAVGCDGHRLATSTRPMGTGPKVEPWRVPEDAMLSVLGMCDGDTALSRKDERLVVTSGGFRFALPMYDAAGYAPWRQVLPTVKHRMRLSRPGLVEAMGGVAVVADDKTAAVTLTFAPHEVVLTATGTGEASFTVPGEWDGKPQKVALSIVYLMQALEHATGDTVTLGWAAEDMAPFQVGEGGYVMPRRA
jgi:DNA polymerase III sliding clamp (beta) subunit (PCNA family)